ncbi:MAG: hypothetical protein EPN26_08900 [Rhodospirillales bacterium]|nr:MAG: hypothetical protein EPN26_08900 [Rhodospirillales bacterium]
MAVIFCIGLLEFGLRAADTQWERERSLFAEPRERLQYQSLDDGLYRLIPNQSASTSGICFEARPVSTNRQGFRGQKDWPEVGGIALLGDSFVEALQIADGQTLADHLQAATSMPVLNAGLSGLGTIGEFEIWKRFVKQHRPDHVVLFVYLGNDIADNSCALTTSRSPCGRAAQKPQTSVTMNAAAEVSDPANSTSSPAWRTFLRRNLALYALLHDAKIALAGHFADSVGTRWGLYAAEPGPEWETAWALTETTLSDLASDVRASGATFSIVAIPEHMASAPDPASQLKRQAGSAVPPGFDPTRPSRRLMSIADRLGIPALDLMSIFIAYREKHGLPEPYFSFSCDGHWNPLGHVLAAAAVGEFLRPGQGLSAVMSLPPRRILDEETYRRVYE